MEDFFYAGGLPAVHAQIARPAPPRRADRDRPDRGRGDPRREDRQRRRDPDPRPRTPRGGQPRDPARQPVPGRRGAQGLRGQPAAAPARGTGRRLPERRRAARDDRRSGPRHPARRRPRAPERRAGGRAGHARVRPPADALVPPAAGRHRHGPDQRRTDERHRVRDRRPPRRPGVGDRRPARPRPDGRPHPARHRRPATRPARRRRGAGGTAGGCGCRGRRATFAAIAGCTSGR